MPARHLDFLVEEPSMEAFLQAWLGRVLPEDCTLGVHPYPGKPRDDVAASPHCVPPTWASIGTGRGLLHLLDCDLASATDSPHASTRTRCRRHRRADRRGHARGPSGRDRERGTVLLPVSSDSPKPALPCFLTATWAHAPGPAPGTRTWCANASMWGLQSPCIGSDDCFSLRRRQVRIRRQFPPNRHSGSLAQPLDGVEVTPEAAAQGAKRDSSCAQPQAPLRSGATSSADPARFPDEVAGVCGCVGRRTQAGLPSREATAPEGVAGTDRGHEAEHPIWDTVPGP